MDQKKTNYLQITGILLIVLAVIAILVRLPIGERPSMRFVTYTVLSLIQMEIGFAALRKKKFAWIAGIIFIIIARIITEFANYYLADPRVFSFSWSIVAPSIIPLVLAIGLYLGRDESEVASLPKVKPAIKSNKGKNSKVQPKIKQAKTV